MATRYISLARPTNRSQVPHVQASARTQRTTQDKERGWDGSPCHSDRPVPAHVSRDRLIARELCFRIRGYTEVNCGPMVVCRLCADFLPATDCSRLAVGKPIL